MNNHNAPLKSHTRAVYGRSGGGLLPVDICRPTFAERTNADQDICRPDICRFYIVICRSRHLPIQTFADPRICQSQYQDICRSRHLPIQTFADPDICRSRHLPIGQMIGYQVIQILKEFFKYETIDQIKNILM